VEEAAPLQAVVISAGRRDCERREERGERWRNEEEEEGWEYDRWASRGSHHFLNVKLTCGSHEFYYFFR
jgi:hypothetical protein